MSKNFQKIKRYYDRGLWSINMVYNVVGKRTGSIEEEFQLITGIPYEEFDPEGE